MVGALVAAFAVAAPLGAAQAADPVPNLSLATSWSVVLPDAGGPIAESSPNLANLDGSPAVVVGDRAGKVYALHLSNGSTVAGWPYNAGAPVDSTPSVAAVDAGGLDSVYVGSGNASAPTTGGYQAISPSGGDQWFVQETNPATDPTAHSGVQASLAVGALQGTTAVTAGSLGENQYALGATNGAVLGGFPWFQADSDFSTPAIADLYGNGQNEIVEGGDSTAGLAYNETYANGGHIRVLSATGNAGTPTPAGGLDCVNDYTQTIQSSPAVGEFLGGSTVGIVFGTGTTFSGSANTNQVIATDAHCNNRWATTLNGSTATSSPALADVLGNGQLQVVEGTSAGTVYVLNGSNGSVAWSASTAGPVLGSVVTADLSGQGYQDLVVPTTNGVQIFDGRSGKLLTTVLPNEGFQNAPLVTDDADGTIGITVAGYVENGGQLQGVVTHFSLAGTNGAAVNESGAWPMFHHDAQLTGDAGTPPPVVVVPCNAPRGGPQGYVLAASDGGIFNYGNLPFCGSLGNLTLNAPVVAVAESHDGGGYWMTASDGGIFAFDDAGFYGSMGGRPLNAPIVGMAATPDGGGYWLVAADGGLFAFGDASFHGSMGGQHLDAPVVGMAGDPATGGYWEVASDGGVFAYDAPFFGSMGGRPLNAPIVGMAATTSGAGYRFVAADGGIFSYNAPFFGSMGGQPLNRPIVSMAGF
ncbi:MAG TPA: hypothetical protein VGL60_06390 [Acidimicrobiales bacterium]